jgi:SSS family solute:Na+ symporter
MESMTTVLLAQNIFEGFKLSPLDYVAFLAYFFCLSSIGYVAGRKKRGDDSEGYFLGGRSLPWYVVGSSYIAANISSEQFIGTIGAACIYGICVATPEWSCVIAFTFLIWIFIPFLMSAKVFTIPEFLERRFNRGMRDSFTVVTILINVLAVMAGVLWGGGEAIMELFHLDEAQWLQNIPVFGQLNPIWFSITVLAIVAGGWAIWGGLSSVAWMDVLTVVVMIAGGLAVTFFGLKHLSETYGEQGGSVTEGFQIMLEKNQAQEGAWAEGVQKHIPNLMIHADEDATYNRLSVVQPASHTFMPWTHWAFSFFYIGLWYLVINQFMVQRIFAAKNEYHARMGIVFAGYLKLLLPFIIVIPGLIWFAKAPEILNQEWEKAGSEANRVYVRLLQEMVGVGLRGLFLAALFGAIQSTISAVLNSTSTIFTFDVYKRLFNKTASERQLVLVGKMSSIVILFVAIVLAYLLSQSKQNLFYVIQMFYSFFAPPFSAVFLLGSLWKRINGKGAMTAVVVGFMVAIGFKVYTDSLPNWIDGFEPWVWLTTFPIQALTTWAVSMGVCVGVSLVTDPPRPDQVTDDLKFNIRALNIKAGLGNHWYSSVTFWWLLSMIIMFVFIYIFGVKF